MRTRRDGGGSGRDENPRPLISESSADLSLRQTRMTRITSGVQNCQCKRDLSAAVNPSRYDDTERKRDEQKIRKRREFTLSASRHLRSQSNSRKCCADLLLYLILKLIYAFKMFCIKFVMAQCIWEGRKLCSSQRQHRKLFILQFFKRKIPARELNIISVCSK